jgi:hypothetical protein
MSLQVLQERLTALQTTTKQIEELISRLANFKFQPGSIPLDDEDGDVSTELSNEIHQTLKEQVEDLELLEQEVQDLPSGRPGSDRERDKAELRSRVARASQELKLYAQIHDHLLEYAHNKAELAHPSAKPSSPPSKTLTPPNGQNVLYSFPRSRTPPHPPSPYQLSGGRTWHRLLNFLKTKRLSMHPAM